MHNNGSHCNKFLYMTSQGNHVSHESFKKVGCLSMIWEGKACSIQVIPNKLVKLGHKVLQFIMKFTTQRSQSGIYFLC